MNSRIICAILPLLTVPLLAADSSPKEEVIGAAKKLAQKDSYGWKASSEFGNFGSSTEGKADKAGLIGLAITFGGSTTEAFLKGGKGAVKPADKEWQSLAELENAEGQMQFLVRRLQTFKAPADVAQDLAGKAKELRKEGDVYSGDLSEAGAQELLLFGRRRGDDPEPKHAKGSVRIWLKDGLLLKYELKLQGTVNFGGDDQDLEGTTKAEIKDIGSTKLEVPEAAKKKLS